MASGKSDTAVGLLWSLVVRGEVILEKELEKSLVPMGGALWDVDA